MFLVLLSSRYGRLSPAVPIHSDRKGCGCGCGHRGRFGSSRPAGRALNQAGHWGMGGKELLGVTWVTNSRGRSDMV